MSVFSYKYKQLFLLNFLPMITSVDWVDDLIAAAQIEPESDKNSHFKRISVYIALRRSSATTSITG